MSDSIPWYCRLLRCLGWTVEQEFQVMRKYHQGDTRICISGMPSRHAASLKCVHQGEWVRRVITIWSDK